MPIGALIDNKDEREAFLEASWDRAAGKLDGIEREAVVTDWTYLLKVCFGGVYTQRDWQHSRELMDGCRLLIHQYMSGVTLGERPTPLIVPPNLRAEVGLFKQLTWYYVIFDPRLATLQLGQQRLVRELCHTLHAWLKEADRQNRLERVPRQLSWALKLTRIEVGRERYQGPDARYARAVADYIASLTESQAVDLYRRVVSPTGQSVLDPWMIY